MKNEETAATQFIIRHSAFILRFGIRGEIMIILRFERRVCRWESCRMHHLTTAHRAIG